jgi:hypothetical protein
MAYSIYGTFTISDAEHIGVTFNARCIGNRGYERHLTTGKVYSVTITPRILSTRPLCKLVGDNGDGVECHLERFEKVKP